MARIDEKQKERLRTATVEVLLELRRAYLRTPQANVRKNWDMLISRTRAAVTSTTSPEEWFTAMLRGLKIETLSLSNCGSSAELIGLVTEMQCRRGWLDLVEREWGHLIGMARNIAEQRAADRDAEKEAENGSA